MSARLAVCLAMCWWSQSAAAEDVVHIAPDGNNKARTKITGNVIDYTGQTLTIELPGGVQRAFTAERVLLIETQRTAEQTAADKLYERRQVQPALSQYRQALERENRRWVRREILSQMVWCYRDLGDLSAAVQAFLLLLQSDPQTPHFDCIPLAWLPGDPSPEIKTAARQWLDRKETPAAQLLGASLLLNSSERSIALEKLQPLCFETDVRVAWLARAQVWRATFASVNDIELEHWVADVEKIPEALRAGPYYIVGRALAVKQQPERAALSMLRVPLLYPRDAMLGARALLEAGRELEKVGQKSEAASLYRELVERHPQTTIASEAQGRLKELSAATK